MTGIWVPMVMTKKVCQRLADHASSLRWVLIRPNQLIGLKKRIHLGASSSWDSRPVIYVRSTESSTVDTLCCCEHRFNCSARRESGNISLRSRKDFQWLSICWMTLCCEGMSAYGNSNVGDRDLILHKGILKEEVNLRDWEEQTPTTERHRPGIWVHHYPQHWPVTETTPLSNYTQWETWSGCHGEAEEGTMTTRTGP